MAERFLASSYLDIGFVIFKAKKDCVNRMKSIIQSELNEFIVGLMCRLKKFIQL